MSTLTLTTPRLKLVLQTPEEVLAWVASLPPVVRAEVSADWLARVKVTAAGDPWSLTFAVRERTSDASVGGCGYKGPPDAAGMVEIAYGIDDECQGRGFATEAARALTEFAFANRLVRVVRAHTKPDNRASERVLEKCGFQQVGQVVDPEDGLVTRWERGPASSE